MDLTDKRKQELKGMAVARRLEIIDCWWFEDVAEWRFENELTDEEMDYLLEQ